VQAAGGEHRQRRVHVVPWVARPLRTRPPFWLAQDQVGQLGCEAGVCSEQVAVRVLAAHHVVLDLFGQVGIRLQLRTQVAQVERARPGGDRPGARVIGVMLSAEFAADPVSVSGIYFADGDGEVLYVVDGVGRTPVGA